MIRMFCNALACLFYCLFFPAFCVHLSGNSTNVPTSIHEILSTIPRQDVDALEKFFRSLFIQSGFAYTLLGEKPMTCLDYNLGVTLKVLPDKKTMNSIAAGFSGMQIWKKYKHLFPMIKFEFIDYVSNDYSVFGFILFDKLAIRDLFEKNGDLLASVFGDEEHLYQWFGQPPFGIITKESHRPRFHHAFGILLGYGYRNSMAFQRRDEMIQFLKSAPLNLKALNVADINYVQSSKVCSEEEAESKNFTNSQVNDAIETLNTLKKKYKFTVATNRETVLSPIDLPGFLSLSDDSETQQIKRDYDNVRSRIVEIFYSENFLETILTLLMS